ncbi:MAG TPA: hypothetical protein VKV27_09810 [Solirubrobacteraceae bacterium]|nr:hypothetical protein [Solirubrobacteraceae bacterium]
MLFDLRSRGRRRTVQAVYLSLAVLMGGGLVLFGVGTGNGFGGLLNGLTGSGSNDQGQIISSQVRAAEAQVKRDPNSAAAWGNLVQAHYQNASSNGYNSNTGTYTAAGKRELAQVGAAWQRYLKLTSHPSANYAIEAGDAYGVLGQYANEAAAWEDATIADPSSVRGFECLAISAYAAGETRVGDLAAAKAEAMVPAATRKQVSGLIDTAKTTPSLAQSC